MVVYLSHHSSKDTVDWSQEGLRAHSAYGASELHWRRNLQTAALLSEHERSPLTGERLDAAIEDLKGRLMASHPVLPILTGDFKITDKDSQFPLVFKLFSPSMKELNDAFQTTGADAFMNEVYELVGNFFKGLHPEIDSELHLLSKDFKGGKAILDLKGPHREVRDAVLSQISFAERVRVFQETLRQLFLDFNQRQSVSFKDGLEPRMVFGSAAWLSEGRDLSLEDLVRQFTAAEMVANMTERRLAEERHGPGLNPRSPSVHLEVSSLKEYLSVDFVRAFQPFAQLYRDHRDDPIWQGLFQVTDFKFTPRSKKLPFLSFDLIQTLKKGLVHERFPFLTEPHIKIFKDLYNVVNTVDVLKPYVAKHKDRFYDRLKRIAFLLQEQPQTEAEKQSYLSRLAEEADLHLKNESHPEGIEISHTSLGFARKIHRVLVEGDETGEFALLLGDERGFSPRNVLGYFYDYCEFIKGYKSDEALGSLLDSTGDRLTEELRVGERDFVETLGPESWVVTDSTGGDERRTLVRVTDGFEERRDQYLANNDVRLAVCHLPSGKFTLDQVAQLMALYDVASERAFELLKAGEAADVEAGSKDINIKYVNINAVQ